MLLIVDCCCSHIKLMQLFVNSLSFVHRLDLCLCLFRLSPMLPSKANY